MNNGTVFWQVDLKNRQLGGKYSSLINSIAISMLATLGLIFLGSGVLIFSELITILVFGDSVAIDAVYLVVNCIAQFLMCFLPIKLFRSMHGKVHKEQYMPVEKEIVNKKTAVYIFLLSMSIGFVAYFWGVLGKTFLMDYSGTNEDYLWRVGLKYNYQIFLYLFSVSVIPAISEELLCRKVICDALAPYGQKTAIIISSVLFSLLHANFAKFAHTLVMGFFLGWLYVGTKNIKLTMVSHFIYNLIGGISTIVYYRASQDAYVNYLTVWLILSLIVTAYCLSYLKKYRKESLKDMEKTARIEGRYEEYLEQKRKYRNQIEMLPGENGEEVIPLSKKEKIKGFFSPLMIVFIICSLIVAFARLF